jgi:hypothetical protein
MGSYRFRSYPAVEHRVEVGRLGDHNQSATKQPRWLLSQGDIHINDPMTSIAMSSIGSYDEDLMENPFFKLLRSKHKKLYDKVGKDRLNVSVACRFALGKAAAANLFYRSLCLALVAVSMPK